MALSWKAVLTASKVTSGLKSHFIAPSLSRELSDVSSYSACCRTFASRPIGYNVNTSSGTQRLPIRNLKWNRLLGREPSLFFSTSTAITNNAKNDDKPPPATPVDLSSIFGKIEPASPSGSAPGTKGTPDEEEEKKRKDAFAKKAMKWSLIAMGLSFIGAAGFCVLEWGAPKHDEDGNLIRDEYSDMPTWKQFILRSWREIVFYEKMIKEPSRDKLLPDPLKEPYHQPPYTVVLEMTGVLVHPDWTYGTGWRFKKRPGVDYFLEQLAGPYFEIVIYTNEQAFTAYPILVSLDPNGYVMYRLFRDSTRYVKGKHIKDLSYLNRDLSKTIVVEWDTEVTPGHDRNVVFLPKWTGNDDDRTLYELAAFLKTIAASEVDDVREVLDNYRNEDDILDAFKQRQQMLRDEQSKAAAMQTHLLEEKDKRSLLSSLTPSIFGRR